MNDALDHPAPSPNHSPGTSYYKEWDLTEGKDVIVAASHNYVIWLTERCELFWRTSDALDKLLDEKVPIEDRNAVRNRAAVLQAYPTDHVRPNVQRHFLVMIGEGLARAFTLDPKSAMQMLDKAAEYATARNQEVARVWYLCATGLTTGVFALALEIGWYARDVGVGWFGDTAFFIALGSCAGALGAFFSILTRVGSTPLDPSAGWQLHWLEGIGRILIGVLGAALAQFAVKVGLILTLLGSKGHAGLFLVAIVAGASERLVPTIIKSVEKDPSANIDGLQAPAPTQQHSA
jgi:hypothetical protein